jgi:hypothetical protein
MLQRCGRLLIRRPDIATKGMRSGFEKKVAKYLEQNKIPFEYETLKVPYTIPVKKKTYNPDFILPNGIIVEAKGLLARDVREKMALVAEQNPDLDIRILFMRDNKIAKNSKTRYSDWCKKRNIKYAVSEDGHIPEAWILEAKLTTGLDATTSVVSPNPAPKKGRTKRSLDS